MADALSLDAATTISGAVPLTVARSFTANSGSTDSGFVISGSTPVDTAGTNIHQLLSLAPTIGNASGGTNTANVINIEPVSGDDQVTLNGLRIGNLTASAATESAINIGTGWDSVLTVGGTVIIDSTGVIQSAGIANDSITSAEILDGTIATADIANSAVDSNKLAADAVTSAKILDGTIATADIANSAIDANKLAADAVTSAKILDGTIATADIANSAIDANKLAADAVTSAKILDGTIATADIANSAVDSNKLATDAVTSAKILDGTIATADLSDDSVTALKIAADAVGSSEIAADAVGSSEIATDAVGSAEILADAVGSSEIASSAVGNTELATDAVDAGKILDNSVTNSDLLNDTLDFTKFSDTMTIDAATSIAVSGSNSLTVSRSFTANSGSNDTLIISGSTPADSSGTNTRQFLSITPTIGNATAGTNTTNVMNIGAISGDAEVSVNAVNIGAMTGTAAAENAVSIGAGWDNVLVVGGTTIIDGSGQIQTAGIADNAVTSAKINDNEIVDADINSAAAIAWTKMANLTSAQILVGNASNQATGVAMSGDATISNTGAVTIAANSVDGTNIALGSDAQGDVMYYDGTNWARLAAGTAGKILATQGSGANPTWVSAAGSSFLNDRRSAWAYPSTYTATSLTGIGIANPTVSGTASNQPTLANRTYVQWATAGTTGSIGGITGAYTVTRPAARPTMYIRMRTDTAITNRRIWNGLAESSLGALATNTSASAATAIDFVGIAYDTSGTGNTTDWLCCSGDGTNMTCVTTGVAVAASTEYKMTVDWSVVGTLSCTVNGTTVTKATNLSTAAVNLGPFSALTTLTNAARNHQVAGYQIEQN